MSKYIEVDIKKCLGCKSCEFACAVEHSSTKDEIKIIYSDEKPGKRINVEVYKGNAVPVNCNHCEEPLCVIVCPTGSLKKDKKTGRVSSDKELCIGCKMCVQACPFGVIQVNSNGKGVLKCELCIERTKKGENPACVSACPTHALKLVDSDESNKKKRQKRAKDIVETSK